MPQFPLAKTHTASALAHPNIAFIKYWGNRDDSMRLPANGSISMNLAGLETRTMVIFSKSYPRDFLTLNGRSISDTGLQRVSAFLDLIRQIAGIKINASVTSENNFPTGAGIASSAAAFAALALAATRAADLDLSEAELSRLARRGSGSACRSVPGGFVEWQMGKGDADSFAVSIAPPGHWDLIDCIAVLSSEHKPTSSTEGHAIAFTSPYQAARVADAPRRLKICRTAIEQRDFTTLAEVIELDSNMMHAVMMTARPPLFYWLPGTLRVMQAIQEARGRGLPVCYTVDAGPNIHAITETAGAESVIQLLRSLPEVMEVRQTRVGGPARLI